MVNGFSLTQTFGAARTSLPTLAVCAVTSNSAVPATLFEHVTAQILLVTVLPTMTLAAVRGLLSRVDITMSLQSIVALRTASESASWTFADHRKRCGRLLPGSSTADEVDRR